MASSVSHWVILVFRRALHCPALQCSCPGGEGPISSAVSPGCPGSQHSVGIVDSFEADQKLRLFRQLVAAVGPASRAALGEAGDVAYYRASEEAAWLSGSADGWEQFHLEDEGEGHRRGAWAPYLEQAEAAAPPAANSTLAPSYARVNRAPDPGKGWDPGKGRAPAGAGVATPAWAEETIPAWAADERSTT